MSKILRFIIVALGISVIAGEFNYDVNGFVAGLGLGGFAFALAAKTQSETFRRSCHYYGEAFYNRRLD
ncbi:mechanosensitive ion channel [Bacillus licheniformis]|nr:mechanosensitive ion channel [Bacillus licheniformis]